MCSPDDSGELFFSWLAQVVRSTLKLFRSWPFTCLPLCFHWFNSLFFFVVVGCSSRCWGTQRNGHPAKLHPMASDQNPHHQIKPLKPQKGTTWQTVRISEKEQALFCPFHYPLTPATYTEAYFSISRSQSVFLLMHWLTESSTLPLLHSPLSHTKAFDVVIGSLGALCVCVCFGCVHQCHCYLGRSSSAPNCCAKTGGCRDRRAKLSPHLHSF